MRVQLLASLCAVFLLAGPGSAQEPYVFNGTMTSGWFRVSPLREGEYLRWDSRGLFDMAGAGFRVFSQSVTDVGNPGPVNSPAYPYTSGESVSMSTTYAGSLGTGTVVVNGVTIGGYFGGQLQFLASPATIPNGNRKNVTLSTRFTLVDSRMAVADRPWIYQGQVLATGQLAGRGTVTVTFERVRIEGAHYWEYYPIDLLYTFDDQP